MRKITRDSVNSFIAGITYDKQNMRISNNCNGAFLKLHGNNIAHRVGNRLKISSCEYRTNTTKERLNGLLELIGLNCKIKQINFEWVLLNLNNGDIIPFEDGMTFDLDKKELVC